MSAVMKKGSAPGTAPYVPSPAKEPRDNQQLRRDRRTAAIVLAVMIVLMALILWLASMGGPVEYQDIEYWCMMP